MVFKKKINQSGELEKYKARLCARGDQQQKEEGEERFSPGTRLSLRRIVLATAVERKLHLKTGMATPRTALAAAYIYQTLHPVCSGSEAGSYVRLIDLCITQL